LSVTYPEILEMQVRAIVEATIECKKQRVNAQPEIMIPLIGTAAELHTLRELAAATIETVRKESGYSGKLNIPIGRT
jgi:pyruvate,orthophosphate dikinase